jgi:hypothetical protein
VILVAGDSESNINELFNEALSAIGDGTIEEVYNIQGNVRPGDSKGREQ